MKVGGPTASVKHQCKERRCQSGVPRAIAGAHFERTAPFGHHERAVVTPGTLAAFQAKRWSRGLKRYEAAREKCVSVATYRGWETGRSHPDLRNISLAFPTSTKGRGDSRGNTSARRRLIAHASCRLRGRHKQLVRQIDVLVGPLGANAARFRVNSVDRLRAVGSDRVT